MYCKAPHTSKYNTLIVVFCRILNLLTIMCFHLNSPHNSPNEVTLMILGIILQYLCTFHTNAIKNGLGEKKRLHDNRAIEISLAFLAILHFLVALQTEHTSRCIGK